MKKNIFITALVIILLAPLVVFSTNIGGTISTNTTLTLVNSPYIVTSSLVINTGVNLTVPAGVEIRFNSGLSITVNGTLTATNAVFTSNDAVPVNGSWANVTMGNGTAGSSTITGCTFTWGTAFYVSNNYTLNLTGSTVTKFSNRPLQVDAGAIANLNNSTFSNCDQSIYIDGTASFSNNSTISNLGVSNPGIIVNSGNLSLANTNITACLIPVLFNNQAVFSISGTTDLSVNTHPKININFSGLTAGSFTLPSANVPYVFPMGFNVASGTTFTVAGNNTLKFSPNTGINVDGIFSANASFGQAIYFTSYKDDNWGGDSNEDAGASAPAINDWTGIHFNNSSIDASCVLRRAQIRFATNGVETDNANPTIDLCQFSINNFGLSMLKASSPVVISNTFGSSAVTPIVMSFEANPTFTSNIFSFSDNQYDAIGLYGGTLTSSGTLKVRSVTTIPNVTYVLLQTVTVPLGNTLTIDPGVVIKTIPTPNSNNTFQVYGTMIANGTISNPIVITSARDDNYGNPFDTNKDGSSSSPATGDFGSINILPGSTGSSFNYCKVRYAGGYSEYSNEFFGAAFNFINAGGIIQNCEVKDVSDGINCFLASNPTIQNNQFTNLGFAVTISAAANPTLTGNTLTNVSYRALGLVGVGFSYNTELSVSGSIIQKNFAGYNNISYVLRNHVIIANGANVSVAAGVVIKSQGFGFTVNGGFKVNGTLASPVIFTSAKDDNFGNPLDTNGDGNGTSPAGGEGPGVYFGSSSDDIYCKLFYLKNYFGGSPYHDPSSTATGVIQIENANTVIDQVLLSNLPATIEGIGIYGNSTPAISNTGFYNGAFFPVSMSLFSNPAFTNITLTSVGYSAILVNDQNLTANATLSTRSFAGISNVAYVLNQNLTINSGSTLTINQNVVMKITNPLNYAYFPKIIVRGALVVNGTVTNKVIFTVLSDDSAGGDSNNDGNTTIPARNWLGINFEDESVDAVNNITYAEIRFAGLGTSEALRFNNSGGTINQVKINFANAGLGAFGTANPDFQNVSLQNLDYPIRMEMFSNPTFGTISTNNIGIMGIVIPAATYSQTATFPQRNFAGFTNITYFLEGPQTINAGTTISIPAGMTFKSYYDYGQYSPVITVNGRININGTSGNPVVFTSIEDDQYGSPADIESNGSLSTPSTFTNRSWLYFPDIADDNSAITYGIFRYSRDGINCLSSSPSITNCTFSKCNNGIYLSGSSSPIVNSNAFIDLTSTPLLTSILTYPSSTTNNTITGTTWKAIGILNETLSQDITLPKRSFAGYTNIPYSFTSFTVGTTAVLTIAPGVTTKWQGSLVVQNGFNAMGGLRADSNIVFTSYMDDYYGGDMNSDSTASLPLPSGGYWSGIDFQDVSLDPLCKLKNCIIRYATTGISTTNASPDIQKTAFANCVNGISASGSSNPTVNFSDFYNTPTFAVNNVNQSFTINAENNWWGNNSGPTHSANPSGTGMPVSNEVDYMPFKNTGPNTPTAGDVSQNGLVQAFDASLILQHLVSTITLSATQQTVGDVSGNGSLSALDASYILQYSVGLINNFQSEAYNRNSIPNNASLEIDQQQGLPGSTVIVPVKITNINQLYGSFVKIKFDTTFLEFNHFVFENIDMLSAYNSPEKGTILFSFAGTRALTAETIIANLHLKIKSNAAAGSIIPLVVTQFLGNEDDLTALSRNGQVSVTGTTTSQTINLQFDDISGTLNSFVNIPVKATTTFTGKGVLSYQLQFSYSQYNLQSQGIITTGTISNSLGTPAVNTSVPGIITIAGAGSTALTGTGDFIILRFKIIGSGVTPITNTGQVYNFFNEGDPVANFLNGCNVNGIPPPTITVSPSGNIVILKGQSQQFAASGGTDPYTWNSSNNTTATISTTGLLNALQIGTTTVKATDVNSNFGVNNNIEVRGYQLSIPDTIGVYNTFINIPVRVTSLNGLNVLSGSIGITFSPGSLTDIQIVTTNSLLQSFSAPVTNISANGNIQLSFANSTALSGTGVLFWIKAKLNNAAGGSSTFTFQNPVFNEDLIPIVKNGSVAYSAPASISIIPNTAQLVYGDSLQLLALGATAPLVWQVSDPNIATISSTGILKATRSGLVTVTVSDANSSTSTSGIFQLYDTYLKIADITGQPGTMVDIPVSISTLPTGQSIFSLEGKVINSNPSLFTLTDIITTGTGASSFFLNKVVGANNIQFAMAGVTAIPGNSVLVKLRGFISADAPAGYASNLSFQNLLLNEGTPLPIMQSGNVTTGEASVIVNIKTFIQGYYQNPGTLNPMDNFGNGGCLYLAGGSANPDAADNITVSLMDATNGSLVESQAGILNTNGTVSLNFSGSTLNNNYYIRVKHRNAIETWSMNPVTITPNTTYDFSTAANQAYGNNQVEVEPGVWALYSGDLIDAETNVPGVQDGVIESSDYSEMENAVYQVLTGYVPQDITGDGVVESLDYSIIENNVYLVIAVAKPF